MTTPQEFDVDAWIDGAERPARSVTVYQKAGLIAELDALAEQITNAEEAEDVDGPSMAGGPASLRAKYQKLAQQFHSSALVIKIEGRDDSEKMHIAKANAGVTGTQLGYITIADAITSPKFTPAQLEKFASAIGEPQFNQIIARFHEASNDMPAVSADFLPKASTLDDGSEP